MRHRHTAIALLLPAVTAVCTPALIAAAFADPVRPTAASCAPEGTALSITAFDSKFDKDCLAVAADQAFTIDFTNLDRNLPHNVAIYEDETARKTFFKGERVDGPGKATYSVPALSAGTFFFRCDPHPEMNGTFVVATSPPS